MYNACMLFPFKLVFNKLNSYEYANKLDYLDCAIVKWWLFVNDIDNVYCNSRNTRLGVYKIDYTVRAPVFCTKKNAIINLKTFNRVNLWCRRVDVDVGEQDTV